VACLAGKGLLHLRAILKRFERIYAPPTGGLLAPVSPDKKLPADKPSRLDHLSACVTRDRDELLADVRLRLAA